MQKKNYNKICSKKETVLKKLRLIIFILLYIKIFIIYYQKLV